MRVGNRNIGGGAPVFIIAEAGVNHNGDVDTAKNLVDVAARCGADAVKFQTFIAEDVIAPSAPKAAYQRSTTGAKESQLRMARRLQLPLEAFQELQSHARRRRILFLSSPFDERSLQALVRLRVPALKVASGELTHHAFLRQVARQGLPVLLSTGMATMAEVTRAVRLLAAGGAREIALLHCVSAYPADPRDANLRAMDTLRRRFGVPVGFSDHTEGVDVAVAAVAMGAEILEKHFTLDRRMRGPDHRMSLEPDELARLVRSARTVESARGTGIKEPKPSEEDTRAAARRSIVASAPIRRGTRIAASGLAMKRPGTGIPPTELASVVGRRARRDIPAGTVLTWGMIE